MSQHTQESPPEFATPEGLRALLIRLRDAGPGTWQRDPDAEALLRYCTVRYGALARRHRQTPDDAAAAAFEVLRGAATARADNPWAVVTFAVRRSLRAEERAEGLLCSEAKARKGISRDRHDVVRFGECEERMWDGELVPVMAGENVREMSGEVKEAVGKVVEVLVALGWPRDVSEIGVEYICTRLGQAGNPVRAYEYLRRDLTPLALLDVHRRTWVELCRAVLHGYGAWSDNPNGLLRRLLADEQVCDVLDDQCLVTHLVRARPATFEPACTARLDDVRPALLEVPGTGQREVA